MIKIHLHQLFLLIVASEYFLLFPQLFCGKGITSHFPIARGTSPHLLVDVATGQSQVPWLQSLSPIQHLHGLQSPSVLEWSDSDLLHTGSS